jgi:CRISPR-associated endonuclease/helicase Cas3
MDDFAFFDDGFRALTGKSPFSWQRRLYGDFLVDCCESPRLKMALDIPTGLGKTSVIPIWLLALAAQAAANAPSLPRRLVYVVNRRTVVDQATDTAMNIRRNLMVDGAMHIVDEIRRRLRSLSVDSEIPLAISTLRGELADNQEWQADPARPAIIVGTVDMIGSRLLFSGYGAGRSYGRSQSAGLIGHDSLIVHDEAHLSPAFGALIHHVARVQKGAAEPRPMRLLELSATQPPMGKGQRDEPRESPFALTEEEQQDHVVRRRVHAAKTLRIHDVGDADDLPGRLIEGALAYQHARARVLIYVRTPELARKVFEGIEKSLPKSDERRVGLLTGTLRGYERDKLVEGDGAPRSIFPEFRSGDPRTSPDASLFLVSTSAGEVGVDLDADHLVCDLTTLDSMIQRLGRVNRLGRDDPGFVASIQAFDVPSDKKAKSDGEGAGARDAAARGMTRRAFGDLPKRNDNSHDASPAALRQLLDGLGPDGIRGAFAPPPRIVSCTGVLLDTWALTAVRETLPARFKVDRWLHGISSDPPETIVVWRSETKELVTALAQNKIDEKRIQQWFEAHRIEPQERLREPSYRAAKAFDVMARRLKRDGAAPSALVLGRPMARVVSIEELGGDIIEGATIVLPVEAGGLANGMLDGSSTAATDVADARIIRSRQATVDDSTTPRRWRAWITKGGGEWRINAFDNVDKSIATRLKAFNDTPSTARSIERSIHDLVLSLKQKRNPKTWFVEEDRITIAVDDDPNAEFRVLVSFAPAASADTLLKRSEAAPSEQGLDEHLAEAAAVADELADRLRLPNGIAAALHVAAGAHDTGKARLPWQRAIGNRNSEKPLAKSNHRWFMADLCRNYRHEFGSLVDAVRSERITAHREVDLILHLIAAHHGWARPHFKPILDDPGSDGETIAAALMETPRRYARLQRRFGRWGLAWLEAAMKAVDVMATKRVAERKDGAP